MALNVRQARPGTMIGMVIVTVMAFLAGCQHASVNSAEKPLHAWRILERVGDVRSSDALNAETASLRPGETIRGERLVTTGPGALLILAGAGAQLTVSENTSVRLSDQSTSDLFLNRGRLRVRLAKAVDSDARIQTAHFDLNATSTSFLLLAGPNGTNIVVDDGSVRLATADGRHQATLNAGAAAKIDSSVDDDLFIRPAGGEAFAKVGSLSKAKPTNDVKQRPTLSTAIGSPSLDLTSSGSSSKHPEPKLSLAPTDQFAIRPASRLKSNDAGLSTLQGSFDQPGLQPDLAVHPATATPFHAAVELLNDEEERPNASPTGFDKFQPADPPLENTGMVDSLQLQFDLLTGGLVDQLSTQVHRRRR